MGSRNLVGRHLLYMVGYSLFFILMSQLMGKDGADYAIPLHWGTLVVHILGLFIVGFIWVVSAERRPEGKQLLLAGLLVAIIGHGLCFFNGLLSMGSMH